MKARVDEKEKEDEYIKEEIAYPFALHMTPSASSFYIHALHFPTSFLRTGMNVYV